MKPTTLFSCACLLAVACGGEEEPHDSDHHHDTEETDTAVGTDTDTGAPGSTDTGTSAPDTRAVTLTFDARYGDEPVACGSVHDATAHGSTTVRIGDFRFYVSEVALVATDGTEVPVSLVDDDAWQGQGVVLLDFEDGTADCADSGNPQTNRVVAGEVPSGDYVGVAFTLGVPFAENHQDVGLAPAPLNVASMYWVWQSGYKFLRVDMFNDAPVGEDFWVLHLGSTGCVADAPVEAPTTECAAPNRPRIHLAGFDPDADTIVLDLDALLDGADIGADTPMTPPGCMSGDPAECTPLFQNLGLDFATGACVDGCDGQTAFRVE